MERQNVLEYLGFQVLRFTNQEILENIDRVVKQIKNIFKNNWELVALPNGEGWVGRTNEFTKIIHIDAYRLETPEQIYQVISKEELQDKNNLILIEWPELALNIFHKVFLFEHVNEDTRKISIKEV